MAKFNLNVMSVDDLLALRDRIGQALSSRAVELKRQLSKLALSAGPGRAVASRRGPKKGHKVPPKYRGPGGETWSGRGLRPRWLSAQIKSGRKQNDFLIERQRGKRRRKAKAR
jgi:DNA-binding protein H-NS